MTRIIIIIQDIQVDFKFEAPVPAGTTATANMISDRFFKLSSDGKNKNMSI